MGTADNRNWRWDVIGDRIYSQSNLCLPHIAKQTFGRRGRINQFENVNLPESYCGFGNVVQSKRVLNEDFSSTSKLIRENRRYFRVDNPTIPFGKIETGVVTSEYSSGVLASKCCNDVQKQNLNI